MVFRGNGRFHKLRRRERLESLKLRRAGILYGMAGRAQASRADVWGREGAGKAQ